MAEQTPAPVTRPPSGWWGVLAALLAIGLALAWASPPRPLPSDAPADQVSAGRALAMLDALLEGVGPHPVGTPAARTVEARLVDRLASLGLQPTVRPQTRCLGTTCARIRNVVAVIPGQDPRLDAVLVSTHYDSVRAGPGYGDDGAGTVAALEVARALLHGPAPRRDVVLLFNEGEEAGLWGAQAFTATSPHRDRIHAVVNLEARGTGGPAYLFEMAGPTMPLAAAWGRATSAPSGSSLYTAVYELLPNNTDLTVYRDAGYRGVNLAFLEGGSFYHTPLDDRAHLEPGSVQHLAEQALGLVRGLDQTDLDGSAGEAVFFDVLGAFVLAWPVGWTPWSTLGLGAGVLIASVAVVRRRRLRVGSALAGAAVVLVLPVMPVVLAWGLENALLAVGGSWRTVPWLYRTSLWTQGLAVWLAAGWLLRRLGPDGAHIASALLWVGVSAALAVALPGGAYLGIVPALAALGVLGVRATLGEGPVPTAIEAVLATLSALFWLRLALGLETALGLSALAVSAPLALGMLPLTALSGGRTLREGPTLLVAGALSAAALLMLVPLVFVPDRSAEHPYGLVGRHQGDSWTLHNATFPAGGPLPDAPPPPPPHADALPRLELGPTGLRLHADPIVQALLLEVEGGEIRGLAGRPMNRTGIDWLGTAAAGLPIELSWRPGVGTLVVTEVMPADVPLPDGFVPIHDGLRARRTTRLALRLADYQTP